MDNYFMHKRRIYHNVVHTQTHIATNNSLQPRITRKKQSFIIQKAFFFFNLGPLYAFSNTVNC